MEVSRGKSPTSTMIDKVTQICGGPMSTKEALKALSLWKNGMNRANFDIPEGIPKGSLFMIWGTKGIE